MPEIVAAGRRFTKVYDKGWDTIASIAQNAMAMRVYAFLAKHAGHDNAVVCTVELLAEELDCHPRTIIRATKWLEERRSLVIVKIGTTNGYVLDPTDLWKTYEDHKRFCAFGAQTLASKAQNKALKKRLTHMIEGQADLFADETGDAAAQATSGS